MLELDYFLAHPDKAWPVIREIFYDHFSKAAPNRAHEVLAAWERDGWARGSGSTERGFLKTIITQNVDNLRRGAGIQHGSFSSCIRGDGKAIVRC
ncbi:MAG: hypothetical protein IMZ62_01550 [Chloroflexi bacterium]|nr:hypothetical protein [Chloroflexota bacterium]